MTAIVKEFEEDEKNGVWHWFGVTSELLEKARKARDVPVLGRLDDHAARS
jgi:hypothetical protein